MIDFDQKPRVEWLRRDPPPIVHIGGPGRPCRTGILMAPGDNLSRFRVLVPHVAGNREDDEGDYAHWTVPRIVPNPDHTRRLLDSWHSIEACGSVHYPDLS